MGANKHEAVTEALALVKKAIARLNGAFRHRRFTIDGRLAGDIAEVVAEVHYHIRLFQKPDHWPERDVRRGHDGTIGKTKRRVDVKSTFRSSLAFTSIPDFCLGIKMNWDGSHELVYNGPGKFIREEIGHRIGKGQQPSISITRLRKLQEKVRTSQRIPKR